MIQFDTEKKVRNFQAKLIRESNSSISFSRALDIVLREGLKHIKS